ncbi:38095_t:CDS:2, partial [Gigaspora margarita]
YSKTQNYYYWAMEQLSKALIILTGNSNMTTIITDRELALMAAISTDVEIKEFVQAIQKLIQHVESLHSKLKSTENYITPINKLLAIIWKQLQEHFQKLAYKTYLHQNRHIKNNKNADLEELRLVCLHFAFELHISQQADLAKSGSHKVFEYGNNIYNVIHIDDQERPICDVHIGIP